MFENIKKIRGNHILAILFCCMIFYIGSSGFLTGVIYVTAVMEQEEAEFITIKDQLNIQYEDMLEFEGAFLKNKASYININGLMARVMGQRYMNGVVKLDNGHLSIPVVPKRDVTIASERITELYLRQQEQDKHFLFIMAPYHISKFDPQLPVGIEDTANEKADELLEKLRGNGVPVVDFRDLMFEKGMDTDDVFSKTDHHWKTEGGFWAYTEIVDYFIENKWINPIDPLYTDMEQFNIDSYPDLSLGSAGKRTGIFYAGVDDFSVMYPKFETEISCVVAYESISTMGSFKKVIIDPRYLNQKDYFNLSTYYAYGSANYGMVRYGNGQAPVSKKILTVSDSFGNASLKYLSLCFEQFDDLDMRHFQDNFSQYYNGYEPDIVIVMFNPDSIETENATYDYFRE